MRALYSQSSGANFDQECFQKINFILNFHSQKLPDINHHLWPMRLFAYTSFGIYNLTKWKTRTIEEDGRVIYQSLH